jgi:predicted  nucleic acid-binding Zn-ribbon protein
VALELGANEERIAQAESALDAAGLPELNGQSFPAQLKVAQEERERLQRQVDSLQLRVGQTKKELDDTKAELERIRKTVKG